MESIELEPKIVWKHFDQIRRIPRPSKKEEKIREYVRQFAQKRNLEYREDEIGNIVVCKPGTPGKEKTPITVLQSHLDMVCEKDPETPHNFDIDPIEVEQRGEYLFAKGTTLGADNGIGVALALAMLDTQEVEHGPLECLFTIDEETGLTGAAKLDPEIIKGRRMINLDSEETGLIYVGCAGGGDTHLSLPLIWEARPANTECLEVCIQKLQGGHSGCDIHLGRGNATQLLARILRNLKAEYHFLLHQLNGGDKHNAIPRWASALIAMHPEKREKFCAAATAQFADIKAEFGKIEPEMEISFKEIDEFPRVLAAGTEAKILALLNIIPHGVVAMNPDMPGMVNTSNNLAKVSFDKDHCSIHTSSRSSLENALQSVRSSIAAAGEMAGAKVVQNDSYPGWAPNLDSPILQAVCEVYQEFFGKCEILSIHAGLECGVIGKKIADMDMVSIGPEIRNPHSPKECVHIGSVEQTWKALGKIMTRLAG